jgi:predicted HTH transcriptional regulator
VRSIEAVRLISIPSHFLVGDNRGWMLPIAIKRDRILRDFRRPRTLRRILVSKQRSYIHDGRAHAAFDERPTNHGLDEIEGRKVQEYLSKRSPSLTYEDSKIREYLLNLGLAVDDRGFRVLNAAMLFFAKEIPMDLSQSEIKLARFRGREPVEIIDKLFAQGTILENIEAALAFISRNTRTGYVIEGMFRKDVPEYPTEVVRELVVNAVVHRNYFDCNGIQINIFSDRLEIINPGALLPGLTLETLGTVSIQRNPILYRMLRDIRLVEGMASGIPMVRTAMMRGGKPFPGFSEMGPFFKATLFNETAGTISTLNQRQKVALEFMREHGVMTTGKYAEINHVSAPTAFNEIREMMDRGLISRRGRGRSTAYELAS